MNPMRIVPDQSMQRIGRRGAAVNDLLPFAFEGKQGRVVMVSDDPWFVAKDVAEWLEYPKGSITQIINLIKHVPEEWKGLNPVKTPGGMQDMVTLSLPGVNFFVNRSDKPKAIPVQKFIAGVVMPSIQKTGAYVPEGSVMSTDASDLRAAIAEANATIRQVTVALKSSHQVNSYLKKIARLEAALDKKGSKLTADEIYIVQAMKHQGKPASTIASVLGRSPSTIRRCLNGGAV